MPLSRSELIALVEEYAVAYGIDPGIAVAQIGRESGWRQDVVYGPFVGGAGERGIAQFIPGTWAQWGSGNPYNPDDSLHAWGEYMTWLMGRYGGDYWKALAAYNGGPGNVDRGTISPAARDYATDVAARAWYAGGTYAGNAMADSGGDSSPSPTPKPQTNSWLLPIVIGASVLALMIITRD